MAWKRRLISLGRAGLLLAVTSVILGGLGVWAGEPAFMHRIIDDQAWGDCKALGDIDGDGQLDVVLGGKTLYWYAYPDWQRTLISEANVEFTTDIQVADIDGDGDPDIVVPDGSEGVNVFWFENPRPDGDPRSASWTRHPIGPHGSWAHDVEVGDLNADGLLDVVTRAGWIKVWVQNADSSWTGIMIDNIPVHEGLALADFDLDGDLDMAVNGYWVETPADLLNDPWPVHTIATDWPRDTRVAAADFNHDGRPDVAISISETPESRIVWYEAPPDPGAGTWIPHLITDNVEYVHTLRIQDIDLDGDLDVVFAEMAQSAEKRVGLFLNAGDNATWQLVVLATTGSHNAQVGDLGADGDLDIVGANWQGPPLEWWENLLFDPASPAATAGAPAD